MATMDEKKLAKMRAADVAIERSGTKVILPEDGDLEALGEMIAKIGKSEKEPVMLNVLVEDYHLHEALVATVNALSDRFGWLLSQAQSGFFGTTPPEFVEVVCGNDGSTVSVPFGKMEVPGVDGAILNLGWARTAQGPRLQIAARVPKKDRDKIRAAIQEARAKLAEAPLYKGCAIRLRYPDLDEVQDIREFEPEFLRVSDASEDSLVFSKELTQQVSTEVFGPIRHSDAYRREGETLKVGVLLSGPPGVGKTLISHVVAGLCMKHGWTYVLSTPEHLVADLRFAKKHGPCVVFVEDIDQMFRDLSPGERSAWTDEVFNELDGVDSKDKEVRLIASTNNPELLAGPLCRPGRFDVVIPIDAPDADAAERLLRRYAGSRLAVNESLTEIASRLAGHQPAVVEAVARRAIRYAIDRQQGQGTVTLTQGDLLAAFHLLARSKQIALMAAPKQDRRSDLEKAAGVLANALGGLRAPRATPEAVEIEDAFHYPTDYVVSDN